MGDSQQGDGWGWKEAGFGLGLASAYGQWAAGMQQARDIKRQEHLTRRTARDVKRVGAEKAARIEGAKRAQGAQQSVAAAGQGVDLQGGGVVTAANRTLAVRAEAQATRARLAAWREARGIKQRAKALSKASDQARSNAVWGAIGTIAGTAMNYAMLDEGEG